MPRPASSHLTCSHSFLHTHKDRNLGSVTLHVAELWCIEAVNILALYHNIYINGARLRISVLTVTLYPYTCIVLRLVKIKTTIHAVRVSNFLIVANIRQHAQHTQF